jgi:hypothetical protein
MGEFAMARTETERAGISPGLYRNAVEGAAIDLEREQLECACRTATQAKLPPVGQGFRSRHFEGHTSGFNPDYRGM